MAREHLYRGFHECKDGNTIITLNGEQIKGKWIEGYLYRLSEALNPFIMVKNRSASYQVIPETVGEYTGLTDNNGKKIFEEDIVTYWQVLDHKGIGIIEYSDCSFHIKPIKDSYCCLLEIAVGWHNAEIIGNIFENPELLENN